MLWIRMGGDRAVTAVYDEALRPYGLKISQMIVLVTVAEMGSASPGAVGQAVEEQGGHDLGANVNVKAGRAFCFTYGPDEDAIRRAHEKLHFPFDSITEVRRVAGVDLRPATQPTKK